MDETIAAFVVNEINKSKIETKALAIFEQPSGLWVIRGILDDDSVFELCTMDEAQDFFFNTVKRYK